MAGIIAIHFIIHQQHSAQTVATGDWQQPLALDPVYPHKLSSGDWHVNFSAVEPLLLQLPLTEHNALQVNVSTLTVIEKIMGRGVMPVDPIQQERFYFLLSRTLPAPASEEFIDLLTRYMAYKEALAKLSGSQTGSQSDSATSTLMEQHVKKQQLQAIYFSPDNHNALFSDSNNAQTYLIKRLAIVQDTTLSNEVKTQRLNALRIQYDDRR